MSDRISLRLRRRDMNAFSTIDVEGKRPVVHVAGKHVAALCPACERPSVTTNGTGWRDVIDVVRTLVVMLSICVRRFVCEHKDCEQWTFDERFEGIDRGGASERALRFFADLARGRATRAVARDLGVPAHYLRVAVGNKRTRANAAEPRRLGRHLAVDECSLKKNHVYATVFSDPERGVVLDVGPGRDGAVVRALFPNATIVADAFHLHRRVLHALAAVRRAAWNRLRKDHPELGKAVKDARYALARARDDLEADTSKRGERHRLLVYDSTNLDADLGLAYELRRKYPGPCDPSRQFPPPWAFSSTRVAAGHGVLKEAFRAAMAIGKNGDVAGFAACLELFDALCRGSGLEAFATVAKTFRTWRKEILAYAETGGASNAFAEAIIHQIKNQKRQAHGYGSWLGFRGQILWVFGEAVDPDTGEVRPLRSVPRGEGATWLQPQFA